MSDIRGNIRMAVQNMIKNVMDGRSKSFTISDWDRDRGSDSIILTAKEQDEYDVKLIHDFLKRFQGAHRDDLQAYFADCPETYLPQFISDYVGLDEESVSQIIEEQNESIRT